MSDHGGIAYKLDDPNAPPSSSDSGRRAPYFSTEDYLIAVVILLSPLVIAFWLGLMLGCAVLGFRLVT